MNEAVEEAYFNWLCAKVNRLENPTPSLTYWKLFSKLHHTPFVWVLFEDENRAKDGVDLRYRFTMEADIEVDSMWYTMDCSVLEMLIAFNERLTWQTDDPYSHWFWTMLQNLGLAAYSDANYNDENVIDDILDSLIWRTYAEDGEGGLFPLRRPEHDQRKTEIWYQFCEYLAEND